jgi:hypothetical protein
MGMEVSSTILNLDTVDGGELLASKFFRFFPRKKAPTVHWVKGWLGPRTSLDAVEWRKSLAPLRNRTPVPRSSSRSLIK